MGNPSIEQLQAWQEAAQGKLIKLALAPEREGVADFIKEATKQGVTIALGHSNATYEEAMAAVEAGASVWVHVDVYKRQIVVYSTTSARLVTFGANPFASVMNQGAFWLVSLLFIFFIYRLKLNFLRKDKVLGAVIIVEIILLVVAKFFTKEINGANGWIVLGPLSFQPAEDVYKRQLLMRPRKLVKLKSQKSLQKHMMKLNA